jgi:pimeloyl-ACP methyl ester carboxylesterase
MGHSRGGHVAFRVAGRRPELLRRLILAEPGGELDATLDPAATPGPSPLAARIAASAAIIAAGDIDGGLTLFIDALEGPGAWKRLPATPKQLLRDNAMTLIGQVRDQRPPFSRADAEAIHWRRQHQGHAAACAAYAGRARSQFQDGDDSQHHPSDVRAGAAAILRDRAGFSGRVSGRRSAGTAWRRCRDAPCPGLVNPWPRC